MTARAAVLLVSAAALVVSASGVASPSAVPPARQGADWATYGFDVARTGTDPSMPALPAAAAARARAAWRARLDGVAVAGPVLANHVAVGGRPTALVYQGTEHGELVAVEAGSGRVVWRDHLGSVRTACYDTPDDVFGISGTPAIDRSTERLFVAGSDGATGRTWVHALDLATGREAAGWPVAVSADPWHVHVWGALTLWQGRLYVTTASLCDFQPSYGKVIELDTAAASVVATFHVVRADDGSIVGGGGIWGYGGASVDPATGDVFVATGNAFDPLPEDQPDAERVVRLTSALEPVASNHPALLGVDVDFGSTPVLFQAPGCPPQLAVENKSGVLLVYARDRIGRGPLQQMQIAANASAHGRGIFIGLPAYDPADRLLLVSNPGPDAPPYRHGMLAFEVGSDCLLHPAWDTVAGPNGVAPVSSPTVSGGIVYWAGGMDAHLYAVTASDGRMLWTRGQSLPGPTFAPPIVADGMLFAVSWDGPEHALLVAFAP